MTPPGTQLDARRGGTVPPAALDWAGLWSEFGETFTARAGSLADCTEADLRRELVFCVLGGHAVPYELGRSAADLVSGIDIFNDPRTDQSIRADLERELSTPQFLPRRVDGRLRRYRYPRRKAQLLVACRGWIKELGSLRLALESIGGERERRALLCGCPGIGPKSASWLLRNCGLGDDLAILDVHVLRAMDNAGRIHEMSLPRDYELIESAFLEWCRDLGAPAAAFDLMLWEISRALRP